MAVTAISRDTLTQTVSIVRLVSSNTLAEVAAANYISDQADNIAALNNGTWEWLESDLVAVFASDGHQMFEFDGDDFSTLIQLPGGNGEVTLPVVDGDFVVFDGTLGALKDAGYSASDPAKTKVVMANGAVVANRIACFTDTAGTIDDNAATAINGGNIQAGLSGTAGYLASFPGTASRGSLRLVAANNAADYLIQITNASFGQAAVLTIPDPASATANFLLAPAALVSGNVVAASGTAGLVVDGGAPSSGLLQVATVSISAAEFNGMYAAPKQLVAAPGANKIIVVDRLDLIMTFVSAQYAAGGVVAAQYDSTVHGAGVLATNSEAAADFTGAAASTVFMFNGASGNSSQALFSAAVNKGLYLSNQTAAFTTGDSTFVAKVYYRIVATA